MMRMMILKMSKWTMCRLRYPTCGVFEAFSRRITESIDMTGLPGTMASTIYCCMIVKPVYIVVCWTATESRVSCGVTAIQGEDV